MCKEVGLSASAQVSGKIPPVVGRGDLSAFSISMCSYSHPTYSIKLPVRMSQSVYDLAMQSGIF